MVAAYKRVHRNKGAPGVDGVTVDELWSYNQTNWGSIKEQILAGQYRPQPVLKVEIPKAGGGVRMLGIPCTIDRQIQQALHQILCPLFEADFNDNSFGFRPGRSCHQAIDRALEHMNAGHKWVVNVDLSKFFDRVNHDILMSIIASRVRDKEVLRLIRRFLQAGIMADGVVSSREEGTPQGSPLSPLLSNIMLNELDKELERRGHKFVRYADDFNVYVKSEAAGQRVLASLEVFLERKLRLKINKDKSGVDLPKRHTFLGFSFYNFRGVRPRIAAKSIHRLKAKIRSKHRRWRGSSLSDTLKDLNQIIRGWVSYFYIANAKEALSRLDSWLNHRIRALVWRQWKTSRTQFKNLVRLGVFRDKAARAAWGRGGPWASSQTSAMNWALNKRVLNSAGLVSFSDTYVKLNSRVNSV